MHTKEFRFIQKGLKTHWKILNKKMKSPGNIVEEYEMDIDFIIYLFYNFIYNIYNI